MAHAAPTAPRWYRRRRTADTARPGRSALLSPLLLGLVYGVWAAFIKRQTGPVDAGNVLFGILCGVLFAAGLIALARIGPRLERELHAAAYGAFAAIAMGYLYSLTAASVLRATGIALAVGAGVAVVAFYRYYTHED
ncbi:hypothetical protein ABZX75_06580 [Streptomyces sp. NPDC003038]|uniref:hypothetical protein n=1 Tax=unclassified Streptomyces TaxID=2593676 RepID=UPI0033BE9C49